jgi:hypothetical protein
MQAEIAVGVILSAVAEHADFVIPDKHDPTIAVREFRGLGDKLLGHLRAFPSGILGPAGWRDGPLPDFSKIRFRPVLNANLPALGCESN